MRVLLAEDEIDLNEVVTKRLEAEHYSVDSCRDGITALEYALAAPYDVIILDRLMPGMDGLTVLRKLRKEGITTPVIFLTASDTVSDCVKGLDFGANHYMVKPFSLRELLARIRVLLREEYDKSDSVIKIDDLCLDTATSKVERAGKVIELTAKEYALLEYLMHNIGIILSREKIENHIWNFNYEGGTNVVDVYISYLRCKIDEGYEHKLIHTVRGRGYVMKMPES